MIWSWLQARRTHSRPAVTVMAANPPDFRPRLGGIMRALLTGPRGAATMQEAFKKLGPSGLGFINIILAHMAHGIIPKTLSAKPHPAHPSASPTKMCGFEHCGILSNFPISDRSSQRELPPLAARQQPADWAGSSRYQDGAREPRPEEDHGRLGPLPRPAQAAPPTLARRRDRALRCDPAT